jgi:hypothetical protein
MLYSARQLATLGVEWMVRNVVRSLGLAAIVTASATFAQVGHPVKGSWSGYWGPSASDRHRILLLLDWDKNEIVGTINPGPNAVPIRHADLDLDTWTLTLEADMPVDGGRTQRFVTSGKLENLGSWTNRRYSGDYTLGKETGSFVVTLN